MTDDGVQELMVNVIALTLLLIEKGVFSGEELESMKMFITARLDQAAAAVRDGLDS